PQVNNVLNFVTNAIVAQLVASIGTATNGSSPFTAPLTWVAYDGDGAVIVGRYDMPLSVNDHDTTTATSVATSDGGGNLNGSSSTATFTYTGAAAATTLDLQTTSSNSVNYTGGAPIDVPLQWTPQAATAINPGIQSIGWSTTAALGYNNAQFGTWNVPPGPEPAFPAVAFTATGGTGPYTLTPGSTCHAAVNGNGTSPNFTLIPVMGATALNVPGCTFTVSDSASHSAAIAVTVSP
ncbi:MAG: hypothetical protein ABR584_11060, partial [Candidatus Baltobacteraceae bacterium]